MLLMELKEASRLAEVSAVMVFTIRYSLRAGIYLAGSYGIGTIASSFNRPFLKYFILGLIPVVNVATALYLTGIYLLGSD